MYGVEGRGGKGGLEMEAAEGMGGEMDGQVMWGRRHRMGGIDGGELGCVGVMSGGGLVRSGVQLYVRKRRVKGRERGERARARRGRGALRMRKKLNTGCGGVGGEEWRGGVSKMGGGKERGRGGWE